MIEIGRDILSDLESAASQEWLETNGIGGFASSTTVGLNTRRYHGLLTAATNPPVGRVMMLSKMEEVLIVDGRRYELSTNQYPDVIHPQGFRIQNSFRLDPFPIFTFDIGEFQLEKSVFMPYGHNTVVVEYRLLALNRDTNISQTVSLEVYPLVGFRDYHSTTHENDVLDQNVALEDGIASIHPYRDLPRLYFAHDPCGREITGYWYRNLEYRVERERGLDFVEDLFNPFVMRFNVHIARPARIVASMEPQEVSLAEDYRRREIGRRRENGTASSANEVLTALTNAASQFLVDRSEGKTIIAGYHWFSDWGRDTMIALPGLTLATGKSRIAKSILAEFAKHVDRGMLPNRFPDAGEKPEYNTVDATLWFFESVRSFLQYTNEYAWVKENLYAVLTEIIDWHLRGTRYSIRVDDDGLLTCGEPGVQLTWMDAKIGDWVVTPRHGKPVEIQALWYNALRLMEQLADKFDDEVASKRYSAMAQLAFESFNAKFWNAEAGCLYDVINSELRDGSVRPNQILAVSLHNPIIAPDKAEPVLRVIERDLLTPRGLRTLSPRDPNYIGRYVGGPRDRDSAYHQGTVWPWLMGPYLSAYIRTFGHDSGRRFAADWLEGFKVHLDEACLGQVSEIFDGDAPHAPKGCVAQAWSVAELLRVAVEDVYVSERAQVA